MANTDFLQFVLNPETGKLKKYTPKGANKLKLIYSNVMGPRCIRIHILQACQPYLCILKAYNFENFRHYNWRSSLFYALLTTIMVPVMPMLIILGIWHMIEINVDLKNVAATLPLILTLVQMQITFLAIIINNRTISKTIQQIQNVISQRKFLKASCFQCQFFLQVFELNRMPAMEPIVSALQKTREQTFSFRRLFGQILSGRRSCIICATGTVSNFICHFCLSAAKFMALTI